MVELKNRVVSGLTWSVLARLVQQGIQFSVSILLAHLLLPEDFGVVAMVVVFTGFLGLLIDIGFGSAIIQKLDLRDDHIQSVFWVTFAIGLFLMIVTFLTAPLVAEFNRTPLLVPLARVWAINFIFSSLAVVPDALMQRKMKFRKMAQNDMIGAAISGTLAATLALLGAGVWSLVALSIVSSFFTMFLDWRACEWHLKPIFHLSALRELWKFTINFFGFNVINFSSKNVDSLAIGRVFGSAPLGNYNRAYSLMLLPVMQVTNVVASIMVSVLSSVQRDKAQVKRIYLRAISLIALIAYPIMVGFFITAEPLVLTIYGSQWSPMILPLRLLALAGMFQAILNSVGWVYTSQGRTDWLFWWGVGGAGSLIVAILLGVALGSINTVALAYAIANLLLFYPGMAIAGRLIQMSFIDVMRALSGPLLSSLLMGTVVFLVSQLFPANWADGARLAIMVAVGILSYLGFLVIFRVQSAYESLSLIRLRLQGEQS